MITLLIIFLYYFSVDTVAKADKTSQLTGSAYDKHESEWQQPHAHQNNMDLQCYTLTAYKEESHPKIIKNIWKRIREGYGFDNIELHENAEKKLTWYNNHHNHMNCVIKRASPYLYYIVSQLEQRNMPLEISLLPMVESSFQAFVYSHSHAAGLWQFTPTTGKVYRLKQNWWYDGRRDVIESTKASLDYLQELHNHFNDWPLALAAYNCGAGTVNRAIRSNKKKGKPIDFWSLKLPKETSNYLAKFMALVHFIKKSPLSNIIPIEDAEVFRIVKISAQIDLKIASDLAQININTMYHLNPGFKRWATALDGTDGPRRLLLPVKAADIFDKALKTISPKQYVPWKMHRIKSGESLSIIAHNYKTTVEIIMHFNKLSNNIIYAGHDLKIPDFDNNRVPKYICNHTIKNECNSG